MSFNEPCMRAMTVSDLDLVLQWRNHPDVRRYMYNQHDITSDEHREWFLRESTDPRSHLLILQVALVAQGFVRFRKIDCGVIEWGFYTAPGAPPGTGRLLGRCALSHAFKGLGFHKVCGQVLECNERSVRFHERSGFFREGLLREHHFNGSGYENVVCFGLIAEEWRRADKGGAGGS